jgi:hypothetical protein
MASRKQDTVSRFCGERDSSLKNTPRGTCPGRIRLELGKGKHVEETFDLSGYLATSLMFSPCVLGMHLTNAAVHRRNADSDKTSVDNAVIFFLQYLFLGPNSLRNVVSN